MTATLELPKLTELRSDIETQVDRIMGLRKKEQTDEVRAELAQAIKNVGVVDQLMRSTQAILESRAFEERAAREAADGPGPKGATRGGYDQPQTLGQRVTESDKYTAFAEVRGAGNADIEVRTLLDSTGGVASYNSGPGLFRPTGTAVMPPSNTYRTRLFIRDVIPVISTTLASIPYIRMLNPLSNATGIQAVAEGALKPEVKMEFGEYDAPIRKIAGWLPMTYEILQDAPTLRGFVDQQLLYMVALAEERDLLNGSGSAPTIRGIRQTTGLQTYGTGGDTDVFKNIGLACAKVELADGEANFVAMNPADYWVAVTTRQSTQFDGGLGDAGSPQVLPFGAPPTQVWGRTVVRTKAMPAGKALVGSSQAATILDREQATIRVGDQHADYFIYNKVAVLAEERIGLAVHRPDWFCEVTFQGASFS